MCHSSVQGTLDRSRWIGVDLIKKLPFSSEVYEGVFCEHTLEHLPYNFALNCIKEVHRILKSEGVFRIDVPDLDLYLLNLVGTTKNNEFKKRFLTDAEAFNSLTQCWGHKSTWNFELLEEVLKFCGFKEVYKSSFKLGTNSELLVDQESRKWESLYVEAIK
jgi:predicted SAM-dependent methyltransferase